MIDGARRLPTHHITIRVPWHDDGWNGKVCRDPRANTQCLILARIGDGKRDEEEERLAGRRLDVLQPGELPPCADEHATFMDGAGLTLSKRHPYVAFYPQTYGVFDHTPFEILPWSAGAVPFRWMNRREVEGEKNYVGKADRLQLGYDPAREEEIVQLVRDNDKRELSSNFIQHFENQRIMLDTFFSALEPETSLCFFYAKRTPLVEDPRRVIVAVGRVRRVGPPTEYCYRTKTPHIRGTLWERCVVHSIRPDLVDGFVLPYNELLTRASGDPSLDLSGMVAFAPDEYFEEFSYGSELLPHDGAIASLVSIAAVLHRIRALLGERWDPCIAWVDRELNRLWKARGAFPGIGSALTAFGFVEHGTLLAYEVAAQQAREGVQFSENPWSRVDAIFQEPQRLPEGLRKVIGRSFREKWRGLSRERRALLELLSRFTLSADQAARWYDVDARKAIGVSLSDAEVLANPYALYELDRARPDPIAFGTIDRGMWPADDVRHAFPLSVPSALEDAIDSRRVRAVTVHTLEQAAREGHTLLPRAWLIQRVRDASLTPACPLDTDTLEAARESLAPYVTSCTLDDGSPALQLDRYHASQQVIAAPIRKRVAGPRAKGDHPWRQLVDGVFKVVAQDPMEERARLEKAAVLEEVYRARMSVLIGPAGTGKTTLLQILCELPEVKSGGLLLLAPTGKARVRLEEATKRRGEGMTLAQFLLRQRRYDGETGRYFVNPDAPRAGGHRTVIVDECSMLTEDQFAALLDALAGVDRLVLVGDPRQLPPIGAGRPFVDVVRALAPKDIETRFPRVAPGYGELTVIRRQNVDRDDVAFARLFGGVTSDPALDALWDRIACSEATGIRAVQWRDGRELQDRLFEEISRHLRSLRLEGDDEDVFAQSLGGSRYQERVYFWPGREGKVGAAGLVESWQVLSPLRAGLFGVEALNREVQKKYRSKALALAREPDARRRIVPRPAGPESVVWGDKVINLVNSSVRKTWPKLDDAYVANGDIGVVVGEFRTKTYKGRLENLEVEFSTAQGVKFTYWRSEFSGEEGDPKIELAYALTVHKTQGSQFGRTFVVIPNPCRILSREMLYTALTRQRDELVILHQGPLRDLWRYTDGFYSDVASRMTNLFAPASPREVRSRHERAARYLEAGLIHRTERGELVRSKSELVVASMLHARGVRYLYEEPFEVGGWRSLPDFTIHDDDRGVRFYWEHLGLLDDPGYARRWASKLAEYRRVGVLPWDEGGGPEGTLIVTNDDPGGALDAARVAKLIDEVILGDWQPKSRD